MKISLAPPATDAKLEWWADLILSHGLDFKILTEEDPVIEGALILCGGADYGKRPIRDKFELRLIDSAIISSVPILGICRGMQLVNMVLGGTIDDLELEDASKHHPLPEAIDGTCPSNLESLWHPVVSPYDGTSFLVNSRHHQHCGNIAPTLSPCYISQDGVAEALEGENILLIQWHPERPECEESDLARNWPLRWLKEILTSKLN
jgi:GMP synthase-like glutamine amidotransferase